MAVRDAWDTDPYGDPMADAGSPWLPTPTPDAGAQTSAADSPAATSAPDTYDAHLTNIAQAADPASQAQAQDDLARQLHTDLAADGHDVKWTGATALTIDGRQYELGDGSAGGAGGDGSYSPPYITPGTPPNPTDPTVGVTDPNARTNAPDPNSPEELARLNGIYGPGGTALHQPSPTSTWNPQTESWDTPAATTSSGGRMDDAAILAQIAKWAQMPGADPSLGNDPHYWLDAIKTRGGLGTDNLQFWQDASVGPTAFFNNPNRENGGPTTGGQTSPWLSGGRPPAMPWSPSTPNYTPGMIDESASELPGYGDIMAALNTPGAGDAELQQLVQNIVEHPETLTEEDVARLKAQSAEEAAVAGQAQDEELQHYGYSAGLDSSPWLAGQRAQNAWDRRNSTITANRNIDVAAADRRTSDRAQAANIGTAYSSFQSSKKAQAVGLAVTAALGKAGEQRSRHQLNESLKQAATQLGLTKDNLVMTYLNHAMDDLTHNKQIDLNFDVDMKKLAEQSDEFKQTLLQRIHELSQQDDQFKANYGLAIDEFQHKKDQDAWDRAKSTVGAGS